MKFVLLGANGMMGSMFHYICKKKCIPIQSFSRSEFDVLKNSIEQLDSKLLFKDNLVFLNFIGCIPQKEYSEEEYIRINTTFPHQLAEYCKQNSFRLIHLSTDCVYSGLQDYRCESDIPDAQTLYGITKYKGEPSYGTVLRCSILGPEKITQFGLFSWFTRNTAKQVNGYTHHFWNGLTTLELSNYIISACLEGTLPEGLVHLFSENHLSKYQILCILKEKLHLPIEINPMETPMKYYLLRSVHLPPRKSVESQLKDLCQVLPEFLSN